jgi:hypothetical protein
LNKKQTRMAEQNACDTIPDNLKFDSETSGEKIKAPV